jgi:hypothetical protein
MREEREVCFLKALYLPARETGTVQAAIRINLNEADARRPEAAGSAASVKLVEYAPHVLATVGHRRRIDEHLRTDARLPLDREKVVEQRRAVLLGLHKHELEVGELRETLD